MTLKSYRGRKKDLQHFKSTIIKCIWIRCFLFLISACNYTEGFSQDQSALEDYKRAAYFLNRNESKVYEAFIVPNWTSRSGNFWYEKKGLQRTEYIYVDVKHRLKRPLFNQGKLKDLLQRISPDLIDSNYLPLVNLSLNNSEEKINFVFKGKSWTYHIATNTLDSTSNRLPADASQVLSPDGRWAAYLREHNLFIRDIASGKDCQLTFDGSLHFAYAEPTETNLSHVTNFRSKLPVQPIISWSPDSKKILTYQLDEREVKHTHLLQMVDTDESFRPKLFTYKYPVPQDSIVPLAYPVVLDVASKSLIRLKVPPLFSTVSTPLVEDEKQMWWKDSDRIELLWATRNKKHLEYYICSATTGVAESLIAEKSETLTTPNVNIFGRPNVYILKSGEFIWFSERTGFGHLYLYGKDKKLKNAITSGDYVVRDIIRVDEDNKLIYFTATGREEGHDPYFIHFYSVDFAGKKLKLLTRENADQKVALSPNLKYFLVNEAWRGLPKSYLRDINGHYIMDLEESDFTSWTQRGWQLPERVVMTSSDGRTKIYGMVFSPQEKNQKSNFPILDDVYPGPQANRLSFIGHNRPIANALRHQIALTELGFVVVNIDGRGTPYRSKEFLNHSYNNLGVAGGLADHVEGIKQLAKQHTYFDTTRVGIFGHSGGGYASTRAILEYPDFYKVAVSSSGNHDSRAYTSIWMDFYSSDQSNPNFNSQSNLSADLVSRLTGKLFLVTGDMDDNVHPTMTVNLIHALIKANKSFDFLLIPNGDHGLGASLEYFFKRRWDYFYQHLLNKEPPGEFTIKLK